MYLISIDEGQMWSYIVIGICGYLCNIKDIYVSLLLFFLVKSKKKKELQLVRFEVFVCLYSFHVPKITELHHIIMLIISKIC